MRQGRICWRPVALGGTILASAWTDAETAEAWLAEATAPEEGQPLSPPAWIEYRWRRDAGRPRGGWDHHDDGET